jgi:D-glycero-D-manno-heptose 1,7-bisphosphate phosphatase
MKKYLILDRDGTLIKHIHHLVDESLVSILDGVVDGLHVFKSMGYRFGIITNQSVMSESMENVNKVFRINSKLKNILELEGISIDFLKICPHSPLANCLCRKPKTHLGEQAISEYKIDRSTSYMVGDQKSDIEFGIGLGLKTIFIGVIDFREITPTYSVQSILQAAQKIESSI